jgi:hypothetical protein
MKRERDALKSLKLIRARGRVRQEANFAAARGDVGAQVDRLIVARRYGDFGARRMNVAGIDFDED